MNVSYYNAVKRTEDGGPYSVKGVTRPEAWTDLNLWPKHSTYLTFDRFGRVTSENRGKRSVNYIYDNVGRLSQWEYSTGQKYSYIYKNDKVSMVSQDHKYVTKVSSFFYREFKT